MNLNKKDLFIYKKFLNNMRNTLIDEELDKYLPFLMDFIELNYNSNLNNNYNLEDFIQECFAFFYDAENNNLLSLDYFNNGIRSIYNEMNDMQKITDKIKVNNYDEINSDIKMDFDMVLNNAKKTINNLSNEKYNLLLDFIKNKDYAELDSIDEDKLCKILNVKKSNLHSNYLYNVYKYIKNSMNDTRFKKDYHIDSYKDNDSYYNFIYMNILNSSLYQYSYYFIDDLSKYSIYRNTNPTFFNKTSKKLMDKLYDYIVYFVDIKHHDKKACNDLMYIKYLNGDFDIKNIDEFNYIYNKLKFLLKITNINYTKIYLRDDNDNLSIKQLSSIKTNDKELKDYINGMINIYSYQYDIERNKYDINDFKVNNEYQKIIRAIHYKKQLYNDQNEYTHRYYKKIINDIKNELNKLDNIKNKFDKKGLLLNK